MANKNKQIIIGYFLSPESASDAAREMMNWDEAHDDIKLGGVGILTWYNGRVRTRLVGNRASGTGAKWGLILGGATAILTGGISLIGGLAVGVAAGTVMGSLLYKQLGLSAEDKDRLTQYLQAGGAAVVIMADDFEVAPTKAQLASLGARVEDYQIPENTIEQIEASSDIAPLDGETIEQVDERTLVAVNDIPTITGLNGGLKTLDGVDAERGAALAAVGVTTKQALLERGATTEGRLALADQSQISPDLIEGWVRAVDLSRVKGIGARYGQWLYAAGVKSVDELAQQDAASLYERLVATNATSNMVQEAVGVSKIENWIAQAKALPVVLK